MLDSDFGVRGEKELQFPNRNFLFDYIGIIVSFKGEPRRRFLLRENISGLQWEWSTILTKSRASANSSLLVSPRLIIFSPLAIIGVYSII